MLTTRAEVEAESSFKIAQATPRVNLGRLFYAIHEHGFKKLKPDLLNLNRGPFGIFGQRTPSPKEAVDIYHRGKPERYALTGELAHRVVDRAIAQRPQRGRYGLVGKPLNLITLREGEGEETPVAHIGLPDPFGVLSVFMMRTLEKAWYEEMQSLEQIAEIQPDFKISRTYLRLKKWEEFYDKYLPKTSTGIVDLGYNGEPGFTFNHVFTKDVTGLGSAAGIMPAFLRVIPQVCELNMPAEDISPDALTSIARNSFRPIARMGMMHFDVQPSLLEMISKKSRRFPKTCVGDYLVPDYFRVMKDKEGLCVDFVESIWQELEAYMAETKSSGQKFVLGCPAMARVDGVSAMQKVWDWHLDIAEIIYREFWSSFFEPAAIKEARFESTKKGLEKSGLVGAGVHF